jgi:hypothetical protein
MKREGGHFHLSFGENRDGLSFEMSETVVHSKDCQASGICQSKKCIPADVNREIHALLDFVKKSGSD